jgi:hypothetical protein
MKQHKEMIDNRKVKDDHKQGISRVLQKEKPAKTWQDGKMESKGGEWKRGSSSLTPRKA